MKQNVTQNPYEFLGQYERHLKRSKFIGTGEDPATGVMRYRQDEESISLADLEKQMMRDTDGLIGILDGTLSSGQQFLEKSGRRYEGPVSHAIYLDKSARPVRYLVDKLWPDLGRGTKPSASFLNIDKEDYLLLMGYTPRQLADGRYVEPADITLDQVQDQAFIRQRVARIRALYLDVDEPQLSEIEQLLDAVESGGRPVEDLDALWDIPTKLDGQHVAIVDEVKSSGATLKVATELLQTALPDVRFEPSYWSTPRAMTYRRNDPDTGELELYMADSSRPPWYDSATSEGRLVENRDEMRSAKSQHLRQRIGGGVLSLSFREVSGRSDRVGMALRRDIGRIAERLRTGEIQFWPSADRDDDSYDQQLTAFADGKKS